MAGLGPDTCCTERRRGRNGGYCFWRGWGTDVVLKFRNIDATPADPVELWGVEGILTAIERGYLVHWQRIAAAVNADPHGRVAADLEAALSLAQRAGAVPLMQRVLEDARAEDAGAVRRRVERAIGASGLSLRKFADAAGTSPARLSSYRTGKVIPRADVLVRIERVSRELHEARMQVPHPG